MQEATEQSVGFVVRTAKMTLRVFFRIVRDYARHLERKVAEAKRMKAMKQPEPAKKVKVKDLVQSGQGVASIELHDEGIKPFERMCKKNGVTYAITKDDSTKPPTYTVFFKAKNADIIDYTLKQFTKKHLEKGEEKKKEPVIRKKLDQYKKKIKQAGAKKTKTRTNTKVR